MAPKATGSARHPSQRPTSSNLKSNCKNIPQPQRHINVQNALWNTIVKDQNPPLHVGVREVRHWIPQQAKISPRPAVDLSTHTATMEITQGNNGIHLILYKYELATSRTIPVAPFKFVQGGDFQLEVYNYSNPENSIIDS